MKTLIKTLRLASIAFILVAVIFMDATVFAYCNKALTDAELSRNILITLGLFTTGILL